MYRTAMTLEIHVALLIALAVVLCLVGLVIGRMTVRHHDRARTSDEDPAAATASDADEAADSGEADGPDLRKRAALVLNPTKTGADQARRLLAEVSRECGWQEPLILETTVDDPGRGPAREAVEAGVDVVIAGGGDGTVRAVADALIGTEVELGILPMGTGNLLARNLDIVLDRPEWALRTALSGTSALIDTGTLRVDPDEAGTPFLVMAGIGFDAQVMGTVNEDLKDRVGWLAYVEAGSRQLKGKRVGATVTTDDGETKHVKIRSIVAGNCGRLQGGLWLFPDAVIDDGLLDLLVVSPRNLADWVAVGASILGRRRRGLHTATAQGETFTIRAEDPVEVQIDGDAHGTTDFLELAVVPSSLHVRRPSPGIKRMLRREAFGLTTSLGV